jgi:hypothetical protein
MAHDHHKWCEVTDEAETDKKAGDTLGLLGVSEALAGRVGCGGYGISRSIVGKSRRDDQIEGFA